VVTADHEVFLSFINDDDAVAFHEWWAEKGYQSFLDYRKFPRCSICREPITGKPYGIEGHYTHRKCRVKPA